MAAAALLVVLALPLSFMAGRTRTGYGPGYVVFWMFVVAIPIVLVFRGLLGRRLVDRPRVLLDDAAQGSVYALRVRVGRPRWHSHIQRGAKPGALNVTHFRYLNVLSDDDSRIRVDPVELLELGYAQGVSRMHLLRFGIECAGHPAWICMPTRWKLIEGAIPAAVVADGGQVVWGEIDREVARDLLQGPASLKATDSDRKTLTTRRYAKYGSTIRPFFLAQYAIGVIFQMPALISLGPRQLEMPIALVGAVVIIWASVRMERVMGDNKYGTPWEVRQTTHFPEDY
ncbi:hypothetical protein ACFQLX_02695 [Streptomyces polyrhachis]|uniref:Uncharacterized protein n=1 Tax=Streptomyces polyrhachis TaxID=1282885 RepID=A0ABW2GCH0_9ACTN